VSLIYVCVCAYDLLEFGSNSLQTRENDKESSSETNLKTNSLQEGGNDRGLSQDSIQEELEDEPLQFKGPVTRARSKRLKYQNYSRLIMLQAI